MIFNLLISILFAHPVAEKVKSAKNHINVCLMQYFPTVNAEVFASV